MIRTKADIIERAYATDEDPLVIGVDELDPAFFDLSSGVAGEIVQALVNYHRRLVVVGELPPHSEHFADFAREVRPVRFVTALSELNG
jgi:hypothetical protein